jgi:hypothetical protein
MKNRLVEIKNDATGSKKQPRLIENHVTFDSFNLAEKVPKR